MRKRFALALLVTLSLIAALGQDARAGVTIDVVFQDGTGSALTITAGDVGPGCSFGGYLSGSVSTGHCMDVILTSTHDFIGVSTYVAYDNDNGLAVGAVYEWKGPIVSWSEGSPDRRCYPPGGITDTGSELYSFDCVIPTPHNPPLVPAGTYRIGTIIWDTSGTNPGQETIAAVIDDLFNGMIAIINGNQVVLLSADIVVRSATLTIIPEPGTAALLSLGVVGLVLAARRRLH